MCFDEPIYLHREAFEQLMEDTEQHKICWMYHDILSDPQIAWMFDKYAGKGTPACEAWTTMAWVASGQQENSFYLLFKWYEDFYGPPERSDLYFVERDYGAEGEVRVRFFNTDFQKKLSRQGQLWCQSFGNKVSDNAVYFFGDNNFECSSIERILMVLQDSRRRELETFDGYLGLRCDGEKRAQCATVASYFCGIQYMKELIYSMVERDGGENAVHYLHTDEFLRILNRMLDRIDEDRMGELALLFRQLAESFCFEPAKAPFLSRNTGRWLAEQTERGQVRWLRLGGRTGQKLLRKLYHQCAPAVAWDVFHRWQGDVYFTVFYEAPSRELRRGVYILSRFEDQTGLDVTDLFWLENIAGGVAHLCDGEFFDELLDRLLAAPSRSAMLPMGGEEVPGDLVATYGYRLKESFEKYTRGFR